MVVFHWLALALPLDFLFLTGYLQKVVGLQATVVAQRVWCLLNDDVHVPFDISLWPLPKPKSENINTYFKGQLVGFDVIVIGVFFDFGFNY